MSDTTDDDLATLLSRREHARPNQLTWLLLVLLVLAVGFAGGAFVEKRNASSGSTLPDFAALRAAGGGPPSGAGGFPGGTANDGTTTTALGVTTGTVKLVDGSSLYITDADGNTIKVIVPDSAAVTSQVQSALADLAAGTTVLIRGDTADDGTVTATSVTQSGLPDTAPITQGDN